MIAHYVIAIAISDTSNAITTLHNIY